MINYKLCVTLAIDFHLLSFAMDIHNIKHFELSSRFEQFYRVLHMNPESTFFRICEAGVFACCCDQVLLRAVVMLGGSLLHI